MSWHIESAVLREYTDGTLAATQQFSVEAHLMACARCRSVLARFVDHEALGRSWEAVESATSAPAPKGVERALVGVGVSEHVARLLAATPSLRRSWLLGIGAVLALAVGVANGASSGYLFFLAVAPLLPLAGVAAAFGPGVDPTYEIGLAAPMRSFKLLLIRAAAVLVATIALGLVAGLFVPQSWAALAWLLPSLALVTSSLALSTWIQPIRAAVGTALVWGAVVVLVASSASSSVAVRSAFVGRVQVAVLLVALATGSLVAERREIFEGGAR